MNLIVSPHMDDEMLGCYSVITGGEPTDILYVTKGHADPDKHILVQAECRMVGMDYGVVQEFWDMLPNVVECTGQSVARAERLLYDRDYRTVYIPHPDYNQDHRAVYEIFRTALRVNDMGPQPNRVLTYEQPCTQQTMHNDFTPQYFRQINGVQKGIDFSLIYKSQNRGHRHAGHIENLAFMRGDMIGHPAAEAFEVLRWIE